MNITVFEADDEEREAFGGLAREHALRFVAGPLTPANAAGYADTEVISTFVRSTLSADVLRQFDRLQLLTTRSTGVDHIDTAYCAAHGIRVANVPSYGKNTVAEHTFGLLLTISHRLREAVERARRGPFSATGLRGFDLFGKTLGVVGTGDIGRCVVRIATGFGMHVLAYDIRPDTELADQLGFRYTGLDELLRAADVVTLHVPLTEATQHLIGCEQFAAMRDGSILLNTARGEVVDAQALVEALASGKLSAAGLDVLPEEKALQDDATLVRRAYGENAPLTTLFATQLLLRHPAVVVTPHSAFNTQEAVRRILDATLETITAFANRPVRDTIVDTIP